ncbi:MULTISPECIES: EamA family transporter RarD [Acinetobacter]|jgi:chloramphenicol-sensitive protein RarD|uniref:EamA family transporter RarD n=1 Tax=Acinetobacter TaxID=469 RepID=UPI0002AE89AA|nr:MULTISPECIES: EamA family transporter RarD [Acinetobacter]ELW76742.1 protein RarD [Acinetobacter sp. WC-743]MBJ8425883.1 EamA family transporter RarD [Acinetobacter bereziniae]MBJ8474408.1 EamA family transporter RarD [Acinetobacter bereziniae]MBJ9370627.1 EamA family transporter RarD [Acinetobacter sp. TGL-Y2]MDM1783407.1 EamA family transporter RarD [Acinetobacter bereziniae]
MFKGVALSILASVTFGVLYFYTKLLGDLDSQQTFGWRIIATLPFLTLFMFFSGDFAHVRNIYQRMMMQPALLILLLITSALTCFQLWLFLWGPMNGRGLQVSLGYFLLPLVLVLAGSIFYKEKLSKFQMVAVAFAVLGVGHELWRLGSIAWETISVALGYSLYFLIRKAIKTDNLGGFWWDILICIPVAIYFTQMGVNAYGQFIEMPSLFLVVAGLGALSAIGLGSYILASRYLPMVLFGLLSYLEPVLLALASLALGESISADEWLTYIPIWCAVGVLVLEGSWHIYQQGKKRKNLELNIKKFDKRKK